MYVPPHFREQKLETLHAVMRHYPLATLVTGAGGLVANHVPMMIHPEAGSHGFGLLRAHIARGNDHARLEGEVAALAIFVGVDHYITPAWYATKARTGKVVPTWNYVAVHAAGTLRLIDDPAWLKTQIGALTALHEADRAEPWAVTDAPPDFIDAQIRGIIGLEIDITGLTGKSKLSQNRNAEDRAGVIAGLAAEEDAMARAMAPMIPE